MADIVGSLFGLSVPELQAQRRQRLMDENQQSAMMQARGSVAPGMTYNQAMLGRSLGQAIGTALFGVQDPAIDRARALDAALKDAISSLPENERGSRSAVMAKLADTLSQNPDTQRESIQAQLKANEFSLEDEATRAKTSSYLAAQDSSKATAKLNNVRTTQENLDNIQKQLGTQGQIASGALDAYKKNTDPDARARIWTNTLKSFESLGIDTSGIQDLPESERQSYYEQAVIASKTSMDRIKEESNVNTANYRASKLELDGAKFKRQQSFRESQAKITNGLRQTAINLSSTKFSFDQKKVLFSQANDLLKANERQVDDLRADLQDDIDERTKLETGKQFGLSEEDTNARKAELDARINQGRSTIKQAELILKDGRKQLASTKFNDTPAMAPESKATTNKPYMSDAEARKALGSKYKAGYKFFIEGGRIKGDPA
jgi:hypothetical protein